jgi:hypothetical protein
MHKIIQLILNFLYNRNMSLFMKVQQGNGLLKKTIWKKNYVQWVQNV